MATFKELNSDVDIIKQIKKVGLSFGIVFSKEELKRFNISYGDFINLNDAEIKKTAVEIKKDRPKLQIEQ